MSKGTIVLAAGGTGGHLFPAEALGHELRRRGYAVHLVTDSRAERFAGKFPADDIHVVPSATFASKNPLAMAKTAFTLWRGLRTARKLMARLRPLAVVGFGGYPTVPPLLASSGLGIPTLIHEQNAVMGRANKALAKRVQAIAGGFLPEGRGEHAAKIVVTGNPVRPPILDAAKIPYVASRGQDPFRLVVFGGSQGAQFFSSAVPTAISLLEPGLRERLIVTQQARPEDKDRVTSCFAKLKSSADIAPFFSDMADRLAEAHLVICRSGASTVSELSVIGRPSILVPYPYALDHDQAANAAALVVQGGAQVVAQADLSPEKLSALLAAAMNEPDRLEVIAADAKKAGRPDATEDLADLVIAIAEKRPIAEYKNKKNSGVQA